MIVSCMEKSFLTVFFKTLLWKRMGDCGYVFGVALIFSTILRWWTRSTPCSIYSLYILGRRLGSTKEVVWMWVGGCINLCLYRILTWYTGQSLVPIQTELFWCKISCIFSVLTFSDVLIFPEDLEWWGSHFDLCIKYPRTTSFLLCNKCSFPFQLV